MPRVVKPDEELEQMRIEQQANPSYRHAVAAKLGVDVYIQLLEDCLLEGDPNIARAIERGLRGYFTNKSNPIGVQLSEPERLLLKSLTLAMSCPPEDVLRRLLRTKGKEVLNELLRETKELQKTLDALTPAVQK